VNSKETNPAVVVRPPRIDDIPALTDLHLACFGPDEHVPVLLGRDYIKASYQWLLNDEDCYSLVADLDGRIIGVVGVCDGPYTLSMFMACLPEMGRSFLRSPGLALEKRLWRRLTRQSADTEVSRKLAAEQEIAQVTIIAVDGANRSMGIFPALVDAVQARSRERGSRAIQSGVYKFNQPSRKAFTKVGWSETPELETNDTVFFLHYIDPQLPRELGIRPAA